MGRVVYNVCTFGCLQLSVLQKENQRLRGEVEREMTARQTLSLQLEAKEQTNTTLRSQMDSRTHTPSIMRDSQSPLKSSHRDSPHKVPTRGESLTGVLGWGGGVLVGEVMGTCV